MNSLLQPGSSLFERRLAQRCSGISGLEVPLRDLWNPATCPVSFLPYLAWAFSVDRWDESWTESVKRRVVQDAFNIHQHKGTTSAVRRVVEPYGFLIRIAAIVRFDTFSQILTTIRFPALIWLNADVQQRVAITGNTTLCRYARGDFLKPTKIDAVYCGNRRWLTHDFHPAVSFLRVMVKHTYSLFSLVADILPNPKQ